MITLILIKHEGLSASGLVYVVEVIGVTYSNGKALIENGFTQETRKQPLSEVDQILQEGLCVFFL